MKIIGYDFEVFKHDWLVVTIDYDTKKKEIVINSKEKLLKLYEDNKDSIWVGYNSRQFDQFILKGILLDKNPFELTQKIIVDDIKGHNLIPNHASIHMNNFDISTGFHSLKQLEGFMGSKIKESDVAFDIDRKLTREELKEVLLYCIHDVEETMKVFEERKEEFDSQLSMITAFDLEMEMFNKTKAQLSAHVLGAVKKEDYNDEFNLTFPDTLVLNKYESVLKWYKNKSNLNYSNKLVCDIANVQHVFGWGGIHGAIPNYIGEGLFIMSDIASMYPALMIEYNLLSRNVENPEKYREIRDTRIELKKKKDPMQLPLKIVLNSTYGASKDKYNPLYDPLMANNVCVYGQLLLLDLIEKVEPYCELIQSNTDGILVKINSEDDLKKYYSICDEWSRRSRLDLEHDDYVKVIQKDVNNYIIIDKNGKYKSKGAYVKKLSKIDYDLPIINEALINYFTNDVSIEDTINNCDELIKFQKIVKVSKLYKCAVHGDNILKERVLRVFASNDETDSSIMKIKTEDRKEKIANTPEHCFIVNDDVTKEKLPIKLDKQYYIDMANKRLEDFLSNNKKEQKPKSDIKGVNAIVKSEVELFIENDESDSIFDFINNLVTSVQINKTQFNALAKLGFFKSYGKSKKILKCYELYCELINRKHLKFSDLCKFNLEESDMISNYENKSNTKYMNIDSESILKLLFNKIEDETYSLIEKLEIEKQYYGELRFKNEKFPSHTYFVEELEIYNNNVTRPKLKLYSLKTGEIVSTRILNEEIYIEKPIFEGNIIKAVFKSKRMRKKINGNWTMTNDLEQVLINYEVY